MRPVQHSRYLSTTEYCVSLLAGALVAVTVVMVTIALVLRYGAIFPPLCAVGNVLCNMQVMADGTFTEVQAIDIGQALLSTQTLLYWVFATAICLLLLRARLLRRERRALRAVRAQFLPAKPGAGMRAADVPHVVHQLEPYKGTIIATLIERALQHYQSPGLPAEAAVYATASAEVFANQLRPQYAFIMFCAYALPLLGLMGTLTGMMRAVAWLGAPEADISFATLGASFDAALVALVTTFVLVFFISMTQASEEEAINAAHEYCLDHLPRRLVDDAASVAHTPPR